MSLLSKLHQFSNACCKHEPCQWCGVVQRGFWFCEPLDLLHRRRAWLKLLHPQDRVLEGNVVVFVAFHAAGSSTLAALI